ncbi:hypothetical protein GCM10025876_15680 [Demequina litorisediminis]|uniref:Uncharacterized protein n=1 Tax=Demequina litorisediminis TaxID=1849022 RepID=A0ABQ6IC10_9MICO|nr:hypothetical protein GCM10025876_15680 [Demequina litorisediminis]
MPTARDARGLPAISARLAVRDGATTGHGAHLRPHLLEERSPILLDRHRHECGVVAVEPGRHGIGHMGEFALHPVAPPHGCADLARHLGERAKARRAHHTVVGARDHAKAPERGGIGLRDEGTTHAGKATPGRHHLRPSVCPGNAPVQASCCCAFRSSA